MGKALGKNPLKRALFKKSEKKKTRKKTKLPKTRYRLKKKTKETKKQGEGLEPQTLPLSTIKEPEHKKIIPARMQVVGFNLGPQYLGVDISMVMEIISLVEITEMPESPDFVEGIINVRGRVVPLINLRTMLKLEHKEPDINTEVIISKIENIEIGLIVDNVSEIITLQKEQILPPDEKTVPVAKFLFGIADLEERLMLLLDLGKIVSFQQRVLLKKIEKPRRIIEVPSKEKSQQREILHQRAVELRKRKEEDKVEKRWLVTCSLGDEWYGVDIKKVKEISSLLDIFYIPSAPHHIIGTINLRGEVISVIDSRKFFELPETPATKDTCIIIVEYNQMNVGFIVDSVADVVELPVNLIEPPLVTLERVKADYLEGEAEWDNKLLGLLNLKGIINAIQIGV